MWKKKVILHFPASWTVNFCLRFCVLLLSEESCQTDLSRNVKDPNQFSIFYEDKHFDQPLIINLIVEGQIAFLKTYFKHIGATDETEATG